MGKRERAIDFYNRVDQQLDREAQMREEPGLPGRYVDHDEDAAAFIRRRRAGIKGVNSYHATVTVTGEAGEEVREVKFRRLKPEQRAEADKRRQIYEALYPVEPDPVPKAKFVQVEACEGVLSDGGVFSYPTMKDVPVRVGRVVVYAPRVISYGITDR